MKSTDVLNERIARTAKRLAQMHAQEMLAEQRRAVRAREEARRSLARRKQRLAELVIEAGAQDLPDGEIIAALRAQLLSKSETGASTAVENKWPRLH